MKHKTFGKIKKSTVKRNVLVGLVIVASLSIFTQYMFLVNEMKFDAPNVYAKEELSMRDYVLKEIRDNNIDEYKVYMIIFGESRWNPDANYINKPIKDIGVTIDRGLWMLNSYYQSQVSNACAYDYKCATEAAIKIIKKQGFKPWVVANKMGIK